MWRFILAIVLAPVFWGVVQFPGNLLAQTLFPATGEVSASGAVTAPMGYLLLTMLLAFG